MMNIPPEFAQFVALHAAQRAHYARVRSKLEAYTQLHTRITHGTDSTLLRSVPGVAKFYNDYAQIIHTMQPRMEDMSRNIAHGEHIVRRINHHNNIQIICTYMCVLWYIMCYVGVAVHSLLHLHIVIPVWVYSSVCWCILIYGCYMFLRK